MIERERERDVVADGDRPGVVTRDELQETTAALESLIAALDTGDDLGVLLQHVCQHAVTVVRGADMASVTLLHEGHPETAASTDEQVVNLDKDQYAAGEGPCLRAAATGQIVRVAVEQAREQWPEFVKSADRAGVTSYLSAPLWVDEQHAGALNLYGTDGHSARDVDETLLELYTTAAEGALQATSRYLSARQLGEQLHEALISRPEIEQAKGIIIAERGVSAEQAFNILVEHSQHGNVKLRDRARQLVSYAMHGAHDPSRLR